MIYADFRSDTVTRPTPAMREAMAKAPVGDDVYGDDPTVNLLEAKAAEMLGKEAAIFVSSGTMGNLIAVLASCQRGDEAIMGRQGHTFLHEAGGVSVLGGVVINTIPNQPDGRLALADLESAIRYPDIHEPISRLIILENTQNACGGVVLPVEYCEQISAFARERNLLLHMDGARIFNAAVALGRPVRELAAMADSVTFCLSKGLCAPVGSVLCGRRDFIDKARRLRKILGGGMRQAGIIAAAGIVALETMVDRLAEDHALAKDLAEGLSRIDGVSLEKNSPQTNMVFIRLDQRVSVSDAEFEKQLKERGVLLNGTGPRTFRLVTHHDVGLEEVNRCVEAIKAVLN
ncbi:MAG: low-specificity L-threonine aldolase [Chloroflexi bacterium]|nr:low-specificity L-threonine aldolase [Chloroflexota bacterium]